METTTTDLNASFAFNSSLKRALSSTSNESGSTLDEGTPAKRFKSTTFDLTYIGSPREIRRLRADLLEARNTIINLECRIQQMHNIRKEIEVVFENETKSLKQEKERNRKTIKDLELQLQDIRKREADLRDELAQVKNDNSMLKIRKDEEIEELEKTVNDIKEESRVFDSEENTELTNLNRKVVELQMLLESAEEEAEAQKKLVEDLEIELAKKNSVEREAEIKEQALQTAKLKIKELQYAESNFLEYQEQAKSQAHKLANYIHMEKENERLREENTRLKDEVKNKLILEEEVYSLKHRLTTFKEQEKRMSNVMVQQTQIEMYLNEWRAVARGICEITDSDSSLPHLLRTTVERLQQQEIALTSAKVELESQLTNALHEAKVAKAELDKNQKLVQSLKKSSEQKQTLIHRIQKKLLLVSRERDSYRQQLDLHEKDLTMNVNTTQGGNQLQAQKERIANLEEIVDNYREMVAKLENDLQTIQPDLYEDNSLRAEQASRLRDDLGKAQMENEKLRQRCDQLEIQLEEYLVGNDTLQGGQVYHQVKNPLSECLAQRELDVENLKQEIDRLKRKIKNLEAGLEASKLNESVSPREVQALKDELIKSETNTQKLKDYFKKQWKDHRDIVYMLLGYQLDRDKSGTIYKLTSMYADRPEDQLCFQYDKEGSLNLLENEFSATLEDMITLHLRHQKSIPVFLSAITMDLFNNKTMTKTEIHELD